MRDYLEMLIHASLRSAQNRIVEATCEQDLRNSAAKAIALLMKAFKPMTAGVASEENLMDIISALGAHAYLVAYVQHAPNTELMLKEMDVGVEEYLKVLGDFCA